MRPNTPYGRHKPAHSSQEWPRQCHPFKTFIPKFLCTLPFQLSFPFLFCFPFISLNLYLFSCCSQPPSSIYGFYKRLLLLDSHPLLHTNHLFCAIIGWWCTSSDEVQELFGQCWCLKQLGVWLYQSVWLGRCIMPQRHISWFETWEHGTKWHYRHRYLGGIV